MTVSTTDSLVEYSGNGVTTAFPVPFRFLDNSDLVVTRTTAAGVSSTLAIGGDYSVVGAGAQSGGAVITTVAPAAGVTLSILRDLDPVQGTDLRNQGRFYAETHESVFDRLTMLIQQCLTFIGRALLRPVGKDYYDAQNRRISNVADPTAQQDAATQGWAQRYVASILETGQGSVNNAANVLFVGADGLPHVVQDLSGDIGATLLGYKAAGTGSASRSIFAKLSDTVCVDDFITPGMTDHGIAFQAAIDTGSRNIVCSSKGLYNVARVVNLRSDQLLDFCGSLVNVTSAGTIVAPFYGLDVQNLTIKNMNLSCASKAISGVRIYSDTVGCKNVDIDNVKIIGTKSDPTLQYGGIEVAALGGLAGAKNENVRVTNSRFYSLGTHGALIAYTNGVMFNGNRIDSATNHGMEAVGCKNVTINDNVSMNCVLSALGVGGGTIGFTVSNNIVRNCGGDASITVEHNSVNGQVIGNVAEDCNTSGINVSYGTPGAAPNDKVRNVIVKGNILRQKSGVVDRLGINVYSTTGTGTGTGVHVEGNICDGFNGGIAYAYCADGSIKNNTITNLVGSNSFDIKATLVDRVQIDGNVCNSDSGDHAIQILSYGGSASQRCTVRNNTILASNSGNKSLLYVQGTGTHSASGNVTSGSLHYIDATDGAIVFSGDNIGNLAGTPSVGANVLARISGATSTTVGTAGTATALPTAPLGYMTIDIPGIGLAKLPYYRT